MDYDDDIFNDLADVGARPRRRRAGGYGRQLAPYAGGGPYATPARRLIPRVPGAPSVGLRLQPLGFPTVTFTNTSGTALTSTTRPQRPFKGRRLVVDIARTGAGATGLVSINGLFIGTNNQFVGTPPIGAAAFAATAFDVGMELAACTTALDITVNYTISVAPGAGEQVAIATTMFGEAVG